MSSFKSAGNSAGPQLRNFNVGMEEEDVSMYPPLPEPGQRMFDVAPGERRRLTPEEKAEFERRKSALKNEDFDSFSKKRLEILVGIGRLTRDVLIDGTTFTLRTLKGKENKQAMFSVFGSKNDLEMGVELRRNLIARSIFKIDDQELEMVLGQDDLETRLDLVDEMDDTIIERLYSEYKELVKESSNKYSFKTDADLKEVYNDVKK